MSVAVALCRVYGRHTLGAFGQYSFTVYEGFCIQQAFSEICVSSDNRVAVPRTGNGAVLDYIPQDLIIVIVEVFREVVDVLVIHPNLIRHNFPPYLVETELIGGVGENAIVSSTWNDRTALDPVRSGAAVLVARHRLTTVHCSRRRLDSGRGVGIDLYPRRIQETGEGGVETGHDDQLDELWLAPSGRCGLPRLIVDIDGCDQVIDHVREHSQLGSCLGRGDLLNLIVTEPDAPRDTLMVEQLVVAVGSGRDPQDHEFPLSHAECAVEE